MRCASCGADVEAGTVFCPQCGHRVRAKSAPVSTPATPKPLYDEPPAALYPEAPKPLYAEPPKAAPAEPVRPVEAEAPLPRREVETRRAAPETPRVESETPRPRTSAANTPRLPAGYIATQPVIRPKPAYLQPKAPAAVKDAKRERSSGCRWLAMTALFTAIFLLLVLGVAAVGIYRGLREQTNDNLQSAQEHYQRGVARLGEGNYSLAIAELEMASQLDPNLQAAKLKLNEARTLSTAKPTATVNTQRDLLDQLIRQARQFYEQREWEKTLDALEQVRTLDAAYQEADVKNMFFRSAFNQGLLLVSGGRIEEAIRRFDQALEVQPNNPDAVGQRHLASLYMNGLSFWEANWARSVENFGALYQIEPNYRDVRQRLHDAYVNYGDVLGGQGSWCEARAQFDAALKIIITKEVSDRQAEAARNCGAGVSPTKPGAPPAGTPAPTGTFVGKFTGYEDIRNIQTNWAGVNGRVVNAQGLGVPGKAIKISAFDWSATATTDGEGKFGIGFLNHEITFTLTLIDMPVKPVDFAAKFGMLAKIEFVEQK
jgi:tetratricopeptide (TPR) repeat protein